jgi:hypothetical protein
MRRPMDPLQAWDRWSSSVDPGGGRSAVADAAYPWSVRRFLTATQKGRLEDYTEVDLREFLLRETVTPYEQRHYEQAVRSFFEWCRRVAALPQSRDSTFGMRNRGGSRSRLLQPLLRLAVVLVLAILLEFTLATTLMRLIR